VKVLVGGAPINQAYADHIGADGFAPDAAQAASRARELVGV
jgi:5-methyltetrahydrofolate--homocysteine methyltransferase